VRIVGCAFSGLPGPVTEGVMRLDDVTAVLGPNDAGKSRLLDAFVATLDGGVVSRASTQKLLPSAAVYAELDDAEFERIATRGRASMSMKTVGVIGFISASQRPGGDEPEPPEEVLALSSAVQSALRASRLVAFSRGMDTYWRTWLCLPDTPERPEDREVLERIGGLPPRGA
jgi:hypothetical protein